MEYRDHLSELTKKDLTEDNFQDQSFLAKFLETSDDTNNVFSAIQPNDVRAIKESKPQNVLCFLTYVSIDFIISLVH